MSLGPKGLPALKQVAKQGGGALRGASLTLEGGGAATRTRQGMFHTGMIPNIQEHPRTRKTTQRGRKRCCHEAIQAWRVRVERTWAWEDKCKRRLRRVERIQQRH